MELNKIYNEDCLIGMKRIADESIDCIICDLPYGTTCNKWDSIIPLDKLWAQYKRIAKPDAPIVLFSQMPFTAILAASNLEMLRYEWIWEKDNATGFLNANRAPLKIHENILVFYSKPPMYNPQMRTGFEPYVAKSRTHSDNYGKHDRTVTISNGERFPNSILYFQRDKDKLHPTQKPVNLLRYLIRTYSQEGG